MMMMRRRNYWNDWNKISVSLSEGSEGRRGGAGQRGGNGIGPRGRETLIHDGIVGGVGPRRDGGHRTGSIPARRRSSLPRGRVLHLHLQLLLVLRVQV